MKVIYFDIKNIKMTDYQKGKVYQITTSLGPEVYYGSTVQSLKQRMSKHKYHFLCTSHLITSHLIFKKYGFENCKIELVEDFPCNSKNELETRERFYIENNVCVNVQIPTRTPVEYRADNKEKYTEYQKQYTIDNKEKIREQRATQITCICGAIISNRHKARHEQSKKHIESIK